MGMGYRDVCRRGGEKGRGRESKGSGRERKGSGKEIKEKQKREGEGEGREDTAVHAAGIHTSFFVFLVF